LSEGGASLLLAESVHCFGNRTHHQTAEVWAYLVMGGASKTVYAFGEEREREGRVVVLSA